MERNGVTVHQQLKVWTLPESAQSIASSQLLINASLCFTIAINYYNIELKVAPKVVEKTADFETFIRVLKDGTRDSDFLAAACALSAHFDLFWSLETRVAYEVNLHFLLKAVKNGSVDFTVLYNDHPEFLEPFLPPNALSSPSINSTSQQSQPTANCKHSQAPGAQKLEQDHSVNIASDSRIPQSASVSVESTSAAADAKEETMASSNEGNRKKKNKSKKPSREEVLEAQLKQLQLEMEQMKLEQEKQPETKQKKTNDEKPKNPFTSSTAQKVSSNCDKCARTSERCNEANSKLKSANTENAKLKKNLAKYEGPEDQPNGKKSYLELEKEWREMKQENEELRAEKEKLAETKKEMEKELERTHSEISELTAQSVEKDKSIRLLKRSIDPVVLSQISKDHKFSVEMSEIYWEVWHKQDAFLAVDPLHKASETVKSLKEMCDDPEIRGRADHELLKFSVNLEKYKVAVVQEVEKMQADSFITRAELSVLPEHPVLPPGLYKALEEAQAKWNELIDKECVVCLIRQGDHWFHCPSCPKRTHLICATKWWQTEQEQTQTNKKTCPHCRFVLKS